MQLDFHYYATYCAAFIAGYSHRESLDIAYSAQFVDCCTKSFLREVKGPLQAATTQSQTELLGVRTDVIGLQDITRIWASFHFLPGNLYSKVKSFSRAYKNKYRLICQPNGDLLIRTVELAKGKDLQAVGVSMHVLADTWAHRNFAGTPSMVINNTDGNFFEILPDDTLRKVKFGHNPGASDDIETGSYTNTVYNIGETTIMNLGHGRAGHLPDYSFVRYKYLPAWDDYRECLKDNPSEYYNAFAQMIYAMKYLRGETASFEKETYDEISVAPYKDRIKEIIGKRQLDSCSDWKAFGEELSGESIPDFDEDHYVKEYKNADTDHVDKTFLGRFIIAALSQKSMVTNQIYNSGNRLAGFSIDYEKRGFAGIRDYMKLVDNTAGRENG
ncbi:MAG: hypothetical protein J5685_09595 [Clostridiales bacterium]|nr:hypothetical protein [Clostridiales bacterium]